jgi:hypothetical protein
VIDSLEPTEEDLPSVLGSVRSRLEPRLARHGLRFAWQVTDLPAVPGFGPEMALQAMRVVQEAVTNVVKHAGARTVTCGPGGARRRRPARVSSRSSTTVGIAGRPARPRAREHGAAGGPDRRNGGVVGSRGTVVRLWLPCETGADDQSSSFTRPRASARPPRPRVDGELLVDAADVRRHRVRRHAQQVRDLGVAEALHDEHQHLALALREPRRRLARRHRVGRRRIARSEAPQQVARDRRADRRAAADHLQDRRADVVGRAVLQEVAHGPRLDRGDDVRLVAEDRDDGSEQVRVFATSLTDELDSTAVRQADVGDEDVG